MSRVSWTAIGVLGVAGIVLTLGLGASGVHAEDACRSVCTQWLEQCLLACSNAPVPDECKANCRTAAADCLADCQ